MARTKKHQGFGRWFVFEDGERVAGPMTKDEAEAMVLAPRPPSTKALDGSRDYLKRMYADLAKPVNEELAEIREVLARRRGEDEVKILLRQIEPVLKAGRYGRARRRTQVLPAVAAA